MLSVQSSREIVFQGLSSGEIVRLVESFQGLGLRDSQCKAPQHLCKILPSFTKLCTLRLELHRLEVESCLPYGLTKTFKFDQYWSLIWKGSGTAWKNSFRISHPMLSGQCYRRKVLHGLHFGGTVSILVPPPRRNNWAVEEPSDECRASRDCALKYAVSPWINANNIWCEW